MLALFVDDSLWRLCSYFNVSDRPSSSNPLLPLSPLSHWGLLCIVTLNSSVELPTPELL